jgi:uncharacterized membrane protein
MKSDSKQNAQQRIDQIRSFQSELKILEAESVLSLNEEQHQCIEQYHQSEMNHLTHQWDVDVDLKSKQLSLGMQITSFIGALAFAASLFFLFYQFWGWISPGIQVLILAGAPILTLYATFMVRSREATGYYAKLVGLISFASFVLNITLLGQLFNITPSSNALIAWMLYALILAYACEIRLLLVAAILCLFAWVAARVGTWSGMYWLDMGERPENFLIPTAILFWLPAVISQRRHHGFTTIYHVFSMIGFFLTLLVMSNWGRSSYLPWDRDWIESGYQVAGFVFSALSIGYGVRYGLGHVVATGNTFFVLFLYTKFFDWWWDSMPKSLFFMIIGLTALLFLVMFHRLRAVAMKGVAA